METGSTAPSNTSTAITSIRPPRIGICRPSALLSAMTPSRIRGERTISVRGDCCCLTQLIRRSTRRVGRPEKRTSHHRRWTGFRTRFSRVIGDLRSSLVTILLDTAAMVARITTILKARMRLSASSGATPTSRMSTAILTTRGGKRRALTSTGKASARRISLTSTRWGARRRQTLRGRLPHRCPQNRWLGRAR